jgi:hypothetical protein
MRCLSHFNAIVTNTWLFSAWVYEFVTWWLAGDVEQDEIFQLPALGAHRGNCVSACPKQWVDTTGAGNEHQAALALAPSMLSPNSTFVVRLQKKR